MEDHPLPSELFRSWTGPVALRSFDLVLSSTLRTTVWLLFYGMRKKFINDCIARASVCQSKAPDEIVNLPGGSSPKIRHLLNNLASWPETIYLEMGVHQGSTLIPALWENQQSVKQAYAIDNWSQFNENDVARQGFLKHHKRYLADFKQLEVIDQDCYTVDLSRLQPVNLCFIDIAHTYQEHYAAIYYYSPVFADEFVVVIDDWIGDYVRAGTFDAIERMGWKIQQDWYLPPAKEMDADSWWNGVYLGIFHHPRATSEHPY